MTLYTSDYFDYYLTLVGWIINDGIWNVLVASGFVALPFLAIVLQEWVRARMEGTHEGHNSVLSSVRIENRVWAAVLVIMFAGVPLIPVSLATIHFDQSRSQQCQVNAPQPSQTGWQPAFTELNNQTALVPVWWVFVHGISKAVTAAAVAAIPCGTDLRQMRMDINSTRIGDPLLSQEIADFTRDCYGPSRAKMFNTRPALSTEQTYDVSWIGSSYFQSATGLYDSFHSQMPRTAWPYDPRDAGLAQVPSGGGYPTCQQWWGDAGVGLKARLLQQVDPDLLTRIARWAGFLSQDQVNDSVIRAVISPSQQTMNQGQVYTDYGGQIGMTLPNIADRVASDLGLALGTLAFMPAMDVVRQAVPMVLALLKMALCICLPLVLVFGTYDLKTVVTVSCVDFALFFMDFWFQLARWIDSTIMDALYGWNSPHSNFSALIGLNNTFGDMLINFVLAAMFLVLPAFWISALGWAGLRVGDVAKGLVVGTTEARLSGGKGGDAAISAMK